MYALIRPLLLRLPPEAVHDFALRALALAARLRLQRAAAVPALPVRVMGLDFPHPVGLAAGLDKNGACIDGLAALGFSFVEIGTVTPRAQAGNPRPRLFRLTESRALINRLGFNNAGLAALVAQLEQRRDDGVLGVNIGKNRDTPAAQAAADYRAGLERVHPWASYVTVNLSSPNTPGLRDLQMGAALDALLDELGDARKRLADRDGRRVPLAVKIAPDLHDDDVAVIAERLARARVDAIIATNTTVMRPGVAGSRYAAEAGGLSGAPLHARSLEVIQRVRATVGHACAVIGVGGITSGARARAAVEAGADLVQLYTGLVYRGPALVGEAVKALRALAPFDPAARRLSGCEATARGERS